MSLIFISGVSGVGKSTVLTALAERGFETHDGDEDGITTWQSRKTGERVQKPAICPDDWFEANVWMISRERVEAIAKHAINNTVFLCGSTLSDTKVWDLFTTVICLTIDEENLTHRVLSRTTNPFGQTPVEFHHIMQWRQPWEDRNRTLGAIMIDATHSLDIVVNDIIEVAQTASRPINSQI